MGMVYGCECLSIYVRTYIQYWFCTHPRYLKQETLYGTIHKKTFYAFNMYVHMGIALFYSKDQPYCEVSGSLLYTTYACTGSIRVNKKHVGRAYALS